MQIFKRLSDYKMIQIIQYQKYSGIQQSAKPLLYMYLKMKFHCYSSQSFYLKELKYRRITLQALSQKLVFHNDLSTTNLYKN